MNGLFLQVDKSFNFKELPPGTPWQQNKNLFQKLLNQTTHFTATRKELETFRLSEFDY